MPFKIIEPLLSSDLYDKANEHQNMMSRLMEDFAKKLVRQREDQIIERLGQAGFSFETRQSLEEFARTRLTIATFQNKPLYRELYLDYQTDKQMLIAVWWDTIETEFDPQNPITYKVTAGKPGRDWQYQQ